ncbi:MAG: sigma-70 family RNA polymerase sigma factor [Myxococcota bacterium]
MTARSQDAEDVALLVRWRGGDVAAGEALTRRSFRMVLRFFDTKAPAAALDLTQQTFLALAEGRGRAEIRTSFRAYLLGIARYTLIAHLRHHYRAPGTFEPGHSSILDALPDPASSPTARLQDHQQRAQVVHALRRLPLDHQIALEMHYWNELSIAEIAAVLDCTPGSIKARLFRARKALQAAVADLNAGAAPPLDRLEHELSSVAKDAET